MEIIGNTMVCFGDLEQGDTFSRDNDYFMKIETLSFGGCDELNAVNLATGEVVRFLSCSDVGKIKLSAKVGE